MKQYVIPIADEEGLIDRLNEVFFFYHEGVKDALLLMMSEYHHSAEPADYRTEPIYSDILNDLDHWLNLSQETNTSIKEPIQDVYEMTQFAYEYLDEHLYTQMKVFFGDEEFKVKSAIDITPRHPKRFEFLITVEFNFSR